MRLASYSPGSLSELFYAPLSLAAHVAFNRDWPDRATRMAETVADRRPYALVVDDDGMVRMDVLDILEEAGFRAYEAGRADQGLEILQEHHSSITLLFTDVEMPGAMNGFALARETSKSWPHIGILVASGRHSPGPGDLPKGAHFVNKPFSAEVVHDRIQHLLPDGQKPEPLKR